jgi:hypothetical protein
VFLKLADAEQFSSERLLVVRRNRYAGTLTIAPSQNFVEGAN